MSDAEIDALRAKLAARPRSDDYRQRRKDIDARGLAYGLAADIEVEPVTANGFGRNGRQPRTTRATRRWCISMAAAT
jgi:hypothetical protein